MSDLFDSEPFIAFGDAVYQWLLTYVFVRGNAIQILVIVAAFIAALVLARQLSPLLARLRPQRAVSTLVGTVYPLVLPLLWLVLQWLAILAATAAQWPSQVLEIGASLLTAWIAVRLVSQLAPNRLWSRVVAWMVWSILALSILNLLDPTIAMLDAAALPLGASGISFYDVIRAVIVVAVLLWIAVHLTGLLDTRIRASRSLSPSVQVLFTKSLKVVSIVVVALFGITSLGIDITALAVVGGALGLGAGFGLQKVISNWVSGVVLLLDQSIRPGDVISVSGTYGWVTALGGRYVSVVTRDGVEHLIPNETLITERVENWTHTNSHTRLKIPLRVHYDTDVHQAIDLCVRAAAETERVLDQPECKCLLLGFGDSGLELEVRIWIGDAHNGVQNVKSDVLLRIWELFRETGIRVPYPQRDVHFAPAEPPPAGQPPAA